MTRSKGVGRGRLPSVVPGEKYGRLTVVEYAGSVKGNRTWRCDCECGRSVIVAGTSLRQGHTKSCGCYKSDVKAEWARTSGWQFRHGLSRHPNYTLWQGIHRRCEDPENKSYQHYGAKGIKVCERWTGRDGFPRFLADVGPQPGPRWHLHRINQNKDYEPGNCVWMSPAEHNALHRALRFAGALTADIVTECRTRYRQGGVSYKQLAAEFGVTTSSMHRAVTGRSWKHVET